MSTGRVYGNEVVGAVGFEPTTSRSRTGRSSQAEPRPDCGKDCIRKSEGSRRGSIRWIVAIPAAQNPAEFDSSRPAFQELLPCGTPRPDSEILLHAPKRKGRDSSCSAHRPFRAGRVVWQHPPCNRNTSSRPVGSSRRTQTTTWLDKGLRCGLITCRVPNPNAGKPGARASLPAVGAEPRPEQTSILS